MTSDRYILAGQLTNGLYVTMDVPLMYAFASDMSPAHSAPFYRFVGCLMERTLFAPLFVPGSLYCHMPDELPTHAELNAWVGSLPEGGHHRIALRFLRDVIAPLLSINRRANRCAGPAPSLGSSSLPQKFTANFLGVGVKKLKIDLKNGVAFPEIPGFADASDPNAFFFGLSEETLPRVFTYETHVTPPSHGVCQPLEPPKPLKDVPRLFAPRPVPAPLDDGLALAWEARQAALAADYNFLGDSFWKDLLGEELDTGCLPAIPLLDGDLSISEFVEKLNEIEQDDATSGSKRARCGDAAGDDAAADKRARCDDAVFHHLFLP